MGDMTDTVIVPAATVSVEEMQRGWHELTLRVAQLEAEKGALEHEIKDLRLVVQRIIEHRQKSHSELVLLLTGLVSKLSINDVGGIVSKLVEHNTNTGQFLGSLAKGATEAAMPELSVLKTLDQAKRDLTAAMKPVVDELTRLDPPFENGMLESLLKDPEQFFTPRANRANRCFVKGQVPKERILKEFGPDALVFFNDMTTDPKLNPRPKPEEIVLAFKDDFEALVQQAAAPPPEKRQELQALHQKVQRSKAPTDHARAQRNAFSRLSFLIELLHYYEHQNTEPADVIFAQRLPALVEQLVLSTPGDTLDEKLIISAEGLLAYIINPDHRWMVVNNVGKGGGLARTLKFVMRLRAEKIPEADQLIPEFVRHLVAQGGQQPPSVETLAPVVKLITPEMRRRTVRAILVCDRMRKVEAEKLAKSLAEALGMQGMVEAAKTDDNLSPEAEREQAWAKIRDLILRRTEAGAIATAIRERLNAKYNADEIRQSWMTLIEADPMLLIRVVCQLPYLSNGKTDPVARPVLETYVTRLVHEKYAATYHKVVNSLRNLYRAKPDSPTLLNFIALVKWVSPEAAGKLHMDVGMTVPTGG
jgi:hypothetical protein